MVEMIFAEAGMQYDSVDREKPSASSVGPSS